MKPEIHYRLDFFLTSASLSPTVTKADILAGYKTDHSLITLHLANNNNPRVLGFWKLNTSFLSEVVNEYKSNNEVDSGCSFGTPQRCVSAQARLNTQKKREPK